MSHQKKSPPASYKKDLCRREGKGRCCCLGDKIYSIPWPASYFSPRGFEEQDQFILFFIVSWCNSSLYLYNPGAKWALLTSWVSLHLEIIKVEEDLVVGPGVDEPVADQRTITFSRGRNGFTGLRSLMILQAYTFLNGFTGLRPLMVLQVYVP